ncbi:MAG: DUF3177 family protein [Scytonematopsis contorta HA4267-MV1]|jgi:hypothetical protein|nr:DUF3177 family protein [Scytonematopsis contorta HA4267-MV1]
MSDIWFRPLVWLDYRVAVLFTVIIPLILLIWAFVQKSEAMQRLLIIYWRVSSLLMITVYMMIAQYPISFLTGIIARSLIPISLWFWVDLNDEIEYHPNNLLKLIFTSWRWATTIYCIVGVITAIPFLGCAFSQIASSPSCSVWLEPPLMYKDFLHHNTKTGFLGVMGIVGLFVYVLSFIYFISFKLSKQGRSAIPQ